MRVICCYVSPLPAKRNKIADWYNDLSPEERSDSDEFIKNMRKMSKWEMPHYKVLGDGLGELRWSSCRKQHRMIGFFVDDTWCAVIGCTHKQRIYSPPQCMETARSRKSQIERSEVETIEYDL